MQGWWLFISGMKSFMIYTKKIIQKKFFFSSTKLTDQFILIHPMSFFGLTDKQNYRY